MDPRQHQHIDRVTAMSQQLILQARQSTVECAAQIAASRRIIARSLGLLAQRYDRFGND